jgi:hypothetical protein
MPLILGGGGGWPSIVEIYKIVCENKRHIQLCNDHIYIIPDKDKYKEILIDYILNQDILLWQLYQSVHDKSLKTKLYVFCVNLLKKLKLYNIIKKFILRIK